MCRSSRVRLALTASADNNHSLRHDDGKDAVVAWYEMSKGSTKV